MLRKKLAERRREKDTTTGYRYSNTTIKDDDWLPVDGATPRTQSLETDDDSLLTTSTTIEKVWSEVDKEIYEQQLEHLHTQLEAALIDNQELKNKLKEIESGETVKSKSPKKLGAYGGRNLSSSTTSEGFERITTQPRVATRPSVKRGWIDKMKDTIFEILYDFTDDTPLEGEEEVKEVPLQAKLLKENLQRLASSSKPYRQTLFLMQGIIQWNNPSLTLVTFLIYMYCVWCGWIIQLFLLVAIVYLSINYLRIIGMTEQFGFAPHRSRATVEEDGFETLRLSDKFQLMKQVGQTAQNTSEEVCNHLEKGQNLLEWYHPPATRKVYSTLCSVFIATLFLPNNYTMTLGGLFIGFKLFIIDNIYRKYPKVKDKYDGVAKLWKSLPTHAQVLQRQSLTEEQMANGTASVERSSSSVVSSLSFNDSLFCDRFHVSLDETPLENWQSGKRCTLFDKDRPLVGSKSGRLFLTHSYICFERSPRPNDSGDRFTIALKDIENICKAKPFAVLPGSGMSIEVTIKQREKPYLFGAILHRDQAYLSICDQAMIIGLPWGTDPEETTTVRYNTTEESTSLEEQQ